MCLCPLTFVARPLFPSALLALAQVDINDAKAEERRRKAREQKRKRRAVLRDEKRAEEERVKKQRLDDADELLVSFLYFFVVITFVPDLLSLSCSAERRAREERRHLVHAAEAQRACAVSDAICTCR